jgi:isopentenyldiphosphate isomerase
VSKSEEWFDLVDEDGNVVGSAPRSECHGNPQLMHPVAHVIVRDSKGNWLLQRRGLHKDVQPGKWDTSVGGHFDRGETREQAAAREMREELGITPELQFCYRYVWRSDIETELVHTFTTTWDGAVTFAEDEIDEVRAWSPEEIRANLGKDLFTPNFELEFGKFTDHLESRA